jgi:hypothetical protein
MSTPEWPCAWQKPWQEESSLQVGTLAVGECIFSGLIFQDGDSMVSRMIFKI